MGPLAHAAPVKAAITAFVDRVIGPKVQEARSASA